MDWTSLLETFVNPDQSPAEQATSLERISSLLHQSRLTIQKAVADMELYLTTTDNVVRARGILLLAEILSNLKTKPLEPLAIQSLIMFFTSRLADWPSLHGALIGCLALLKRTDNVGRVTSDDAKKLAQSYIENLNVQAITQKDRMLCLELLECLLHSYGDAVSTLGEDLIYGVCAAIDEEKDPHCLFLAFRIAGLLIHLFPEPSCAEDLFEIISRYFPISFRPPEDDSFGITRDDLSGALLAAFCSSPLFAPVTIPLLLEKLSSSLRTAKLDSLKYLGKCAIAYGADAMSTHATAIWASLKTEILNCARQVSDTTITSEGEDREVVETALVCLTDCVFSFNKNNESGVLLELLLKDEELEDIFVSVLNLSNLRINPRKDISMPQVKMLGRILYAAAASSFLSCFDISQRFLCRIVDALDTFESKLCRLSSLDDENFINITLMGGALSLCNQMIEANRYLATNFDSQHQEEWNSGLRCPSLLLLKDLSGRLMHFVKSTVMVFIMRNCEVLAAGNENRIMHLGVSTLKLLASFPESSSPLDDQQFTQLLNFFLSITCNGQEQNSMLEEVLGAISEIGSSAEKFHGSKRAQLFARVVVSGLMTKLSNCNPELMPSVFKSIVWVCNANSIAVVEVLQGFHNIVNDSFSQVGFKGQCNRTSEVMINVLECLSAVVLPRCKSIGITEDDIMQLVLDTWSFSKRLPNSFGSFPRNFLEAAMSAMRVSVQYCSEKLQHEILAKAFDVISIKYPTFDEFSLMNSETDIAVEMPSFNAFGNSSSQVLQIALLTSVIIALRPQIIIQYNRSILYALLNVAIGKQDKIIKIAAAQALGSIINKFPDVDDNASPIDINFNQAISLLLHRNLFKIIRSTLLKDSCNLIQNEMAQNKGDIYYDTELHIDAIVTISWIGKGLAMRGNESISEVVMLLLHLMKSATPSSSVVAQAAADGIKVIMSDSVTSLNKECHACVRPLYKQRFFTSMVSVLGLAIKDSTCCHASRVLLYRGFGHIVSETPHVALLAESEKILPFILDGILVFSDSIDNKDILLSFLLALSAIIVDDNKGKEHILGCVSNTINCLVEVVGYRHSKMVRETALQCLGAMIALPHPRIFPYRMKVLKSISRAIDDRKRSVRKEAVRCHHAWASILSR